VHSNRRPYHCPYCVRQYKTAIDLRRHVHVHSGAKRYLCGYCSNCFSTYPQLRVHLLKSHDEGTWFICHICNKKLVWQVGLKRHLHRHLLKDEGVRRYVCGECPKRFFAAEDLQNHAKVHSDTSRFCCSLCDKSFKYKAGVKQHFQRCLSSLSNV